MSLKPVAASAAEQQGVVFTRRRRIFQVGVNSCHCELSETASGTEWNVSPVSVSLQILYLAANRGLTSIMCGPSNFSVTPSNNYKYRISAVESVH